MMKTNRFNIAVGALMIAATAGAQSAFDLYSISQPDLKGTARFMAMGGAFGALGGDLSTLNQNPGGIGVYRSSEIGLSFGCDVKKTHFNDGDNIYKNKEKDWNFNNIGYIGTYKTGNDVVPTFSWGFTYNKAADFRRHYKGYIDGINNSMSNYIANQAQGTHIDDLAAGEGMTDPYFADRQPWMNILAYNSYLINPQDGSDNTYWGLFNDNTTGYSEVEVEERGHIDEYSISFGGNVMNTVYWGATVGVTDLDYENFTYYGESLQGASVAYDVKSSNPREPEYITYVGDGDADWNIKNRLRISGTGVNFKLGAILKPVNELRIGLAFHTPTFYNLTSEYYAETNYKYYAYNLPVAGRDIEGWAETNEGFIGRTDFEARTPWRFIGSIAGVVGGRAILSFDYERAMYDGMRISYDYDEDRYITSDVKTYFKPSDIFRVGGELKVTPQFSLRAGYSYQTAPTTKDIQDHKVDAYTAGTRLSYSLDNDMQTVSAGLGYRYKGFYLDMAYVHKQRKSEFVAFSSEEGEPYPPTASVKDRNDQVVISLGLKF